MTSWRVYPSTFSKLEFTSTIRPSASRLMEMGSGPDSNAFWNFSSLFCSASSARLLSVMSLEIASKYVSPCRSMSSAEKRQVKLSPDFLHNSNSKSRTLDSFCRMFLKTSRSAGSLNIPSSRDVLPITSWRVYPSILSKLAFTSTIRPSASREIVMESGLAINAFWNFSSLSCSAFSARLRSVISRPLITNPLISLSGP